MVSLEQIREAFAAHRQHDIRHRLKATNRLRLVIHQTIRKDDLVEVYARSEEETHRVNFFWDDEYGKAHLIGSVVM